MTREQVIEGLQFTVDMFLFDPSTGETLNEPRNDMDKTTIDACKEAIKLLQPNTVTDEYIKELDKVQDFLTNLYVEPYQWAIIKLLKIIISIMLDRRLKQ